MTWLERLQHDAELQAFVDAEVCRAGIRLDTLEWQHDHDRQCIATLTQQLAAAKTEITKLRRRLGSRPLTAEDHHDAA